MLRAVRSRSTPSHGVRLRSLLAAWLAISSGLLAATRVNAGAIERLAANPDSVASKPSAVPGTFQGSTTTTAAPPSSTVPRYSSTPVKPQKHDNYSLHLHGGLFAPIDVNATSPTLGMRLARNVGGHLQAGVLTGWTFRRRNLEQPVGGLPGLKPQLVLARLDGQMVPFMGFIQVNLTVKNIGNESQSFDADAQKLKDAAGKSYSSSDDAEIALAESYGDYSANALATKINPGNSARVALIFDVPVCTTPVAMEVRIDVLE